MHHSPGPCHDPSLLSALHGFASSPDSGKARFLSDRLAQYGLSLHCPDLNEPDFSTLTVTRMIDQVEAAVRALPDAPVVLFGSSLGAFVALHLAERLGHPGATPIERMVLLAPALEFGTSRTRMGDAGLTQWRETGWTEMPHYAYGGVRRVHYELFADAARYDALTTTAAVPTLIIQGRNDELVDATVVEQFVEKREYARLVMVDDGHQLQGSLERVWSETSAFLGLD